MNSTVKKYPVHIVLRSWKLSAFGMRCHRKVLSFAKTELVTGLKDWWKNSTNRLQQKADFEKVSWNCSGTSALCRTNDHWVAKTVTLVKNGHCDQPRGRLVRRRSADIMARRCSTRNWHKNGEEPLASTNLMDVKFNKI